MEDYKAFKKELTDALLDNPKGWDFSKINGEAIFGKTSWDYCTLARKLMAEAHNVIDLGTGGGELLTTLFPHHGKIVATEGWKPNIPIARNRLEPLGVEVLEADGDGPINVSNHSQDLILNRHESFNFDEYKRILRANGKFLLQVVGKNNKSEINNFFKIPNNEYLNLTLTQTSKEATEAGFKILTSQEEYISGRFLTLRSLVLFLKRVPWQLPNFELTNEEESLYSFYRHLKENGYFEFHSHRYYLLMTH